MWKSFPTYDVRAIGWKLATLLQSPFLKRRVIEADIHSGGASDEFKKILEKRVARK